MNLQQLWSVSVALWQGRHDGGDALTFGVYHFKMSANDAEELVFVGGHNARHYNTCLVSSFGSSLFLTYFLHLQPGYRQGATGFVAGMRTG